MTSAQLFCRACEKETNQELIDVWSSPNAVEYFSKSEDGSIVDRFYRIHAMFQIYAKCMGCNSRTLIVDEYVPDSDDDGQWIEFRNQMYRDGKSEMFEVKSSRVYPPVIQRKPPEWLKEVRAEIMPLCFDVYRAVNTDMQTLAVMGLRSIMDMLLTIKVGDLANFAQKLDAAVKQGILTEEQRTIVKAAIEVGHATIHRGYYPPSDAVLKCLDIVEHLLEYDILLRAASHLRDNTPKRQGK